MDVCRRAWFFPGIVFCGILLCGLQVGWAQNQTEPGVTTFRAQTTVVTVPTIVSDREGKHIWALQAGDFAITDNGVPQKVQLDDSPVPPARAVVIVVQENDDTFLLEGSLVQSLTDFLNAMPDGDIPIAVVTAGTKAKVFEPFSTDRDHIESRLRKLAPDADSGGPKILDGVFMAAKMLEENYPDRTKIVLLVSGAHDGDSTTKVLDVLPGRTPDAKAKKARWNSDHSSQEVLQYVEQENVVVDAIEFSRYGMGMSDYWKNQDLSQISLSPMGLLTHAGDWLRKDVPRNLAEATGGEVRNVSRKKTVSTGAIRIAGDFSAAYELSFHPTDHTPGLHEIRVTTPGRDKLRVRCRAFYWAKDTTDSK